MKFNLFATARTLAVSLIIGASLYPFDFDAALSLSRFVWIGGTSGPRDVLSNVAAFAVLGGLACSRGRVGWLGLCALLAAGLQVLQVWLPSRVPSVADIATNWLGLVLGFTAMRLVAARWHDAQPFAKSLPSHSLNRTGSISLSERSNTKPEAVVVGAGLNALGVVRSLAPESVRITVVDDASDGPALASRYTHGRIYADDLIEDLLLLAPKFAQPPVLFLTQEASVALVSSNRSRLESRYRFLLADDAVLRDLRDKSRFETKALESGFAVPKSVVLQDARDTSLASRLMYPCILKPIAKSELWERRYKKAYRFGDHAELARFCGQIEGEAPPILVQEWIEGGDSDVYFTLVYRNERGQTCASFTGRKIRQWPPLVGGTASCRSAPELHTELSQLTTRFFDAMGFVGLGSMEFKRDRNTGRFVMVEPTVGRSDFQEEVSTLNGVNVVRAAYRSLAGLEPIFDDRNTRPCIWRDHESDVQSKSAQSDASDEGSDARVVDALFRVNDPGPWLAERIARLSARFAGPSH